MARISISSVEPCHRRHRLEWCEAGSASSSVARGAPGSRFYGVGLDESAGRRSGNGDPKRAGREQTTAPYYADDGARLTDWWSSPLLHVLVFTHACHGVIDVLRPR